jgi:hypothetical protein
MVNFWCLYYREEIFKIGCVNPVFVVERGVSGKIDNGLIRSFGEDMGMKL